MTEVYAVEVLRLYAQHLRTMYPWLTPRAYQEDPPRDRIDKVRHALWMIKEALEKPDRPLPELFRMLGLVEGVCWAENATTFAKLQEMARHDVPEDGVRR